MGYSQLKQAIRDAIKQNGSNEITGELLQTTLLAMVNALNEGSIFGGVATQVLNPMNQDPRKFYIAEKPGRYPLFRGLTVPEGKIGIFQIDPDDNAWHLETVDVLSAAGRAKLDSDSSKKSLSAKMDKVLNEGIEDDGDRNLNKSEMSLRDKMFATLGDSFTAGGLWGNKMAEILQAKYIDNQAVSGARWSSDAEGQADALIASGKIPDYILIFLGVNDANNAVVLGDIVFSANLADLPTGTFTGGVQRTLNKLMNAFPGKIIKIGWTPAGTAYTGSLDVSQYIERLKDLSIMYGVQYVETRCCDISRWIAADIDGVYYTSDFHPTAAGQEVIGKAMAKILMCNQ